MLKKDVKRVLNGLTVAIFVVDSDQKILFRNQAATRLFGTVARGIRLSAFVPNKRCLKAVEQVVQGDARASVSVRLQLVVPTSFRMTAARLGDRADGTVIVSFEDVSHIIEAEQMRSDFVANVSHELRSPLTALSGFIETLQGPAKGDLGAAERFLTLMETEAQRMARLIDDLLSLSKVQSGERFAPTETVEIVPVLERVVAALEPILERDLTPVEINANGSVPLVIGDSDELTQVFRNLIENASKYSDRGASVTVDVAVNDEEPDMMRVSVRDRGDGIAPEHISRLTERFYRIDKGRSRSKGGTGLGLAIVKHILMRHRGRLQVESDLGVGSVFSVLLPIAR